MPQTIRLRLGDCLDVLKTMEPGSVGTFIMDPPYDLTAVSRGGSPRLPGTGPYGRHRVDTKPGKGFMGKEWDGTGIAFSSEFWALVFETLAPDGVVKAFSGTRTYHRMAAAMEAAGLVLEPGESLQAWAYGSGFPKSLNVSKALDKLAGAEREVVGSKLCLPGYSLAPSNGIHQTYGLGLSGNTSDPERECEITAPATEDASRFEGYGTALKPAWEPVLVGRKLA